MGRLYITEYAGAVVLPGWTSAIPIPMEPATRTQVVEIGDEAQCSEALAIHTRIVRLHADDPCSVKFGSDPEATIDDMPMGAEMTEYFGVAGGQKVSVIANE